MGATHLNLHGLRRRDLPRFHAGITASTNTIAMIRKPSLKPRALAWASITLPRWCSAPAPRTSSDSPAVASSANSIFIISYHEKKRFVEKVDYVTSPGFLDGGHSREQSGLLGGGVEKVITNLGILEFDKETREMTLVAVHPGIAVEEVLAKTGFKLRIADDLEVTTPPSEEELKLLRALDPEKRFLKPGEF